MMSRNTDGLLFNFSSSILDRIFKILILLVFGVFIVVNLWPNLLYKPLALAVPALLVYIIVLYSASKRVVNDRVALLLIIGVSLIILIGWNILYKPIFVSDYKVMWNGAHQIIDGSFYERAIDKSDYFAFYNFQIPYTYYISLFLRLYDSEITLIAVEILTITITNVVLFKIIRLYYKTSYSVFGTLMFASFPYIFIGSGVINNHHIGMLFGLLAVFVLLKYDSFVKYIVSSLLLVVGNYLRPTIIIIFLSLSFVLFIQGFFDKKKLLGLLIFVSVYFLFNELVNFAFIGLSLAPYGIKGDNLYFKFLLGLTGKGLTEPTGLLDTEHPIIFYDLKHFNFDYDKYKDACKEYLFNKTFEGQINIFSVINKVKYFISGVDNQALSEDGSFDNNHTFIMEFLNQFGLFVYISTILCSFLNTLRQKNIVKNSKIFVPAIIFCAYFAVYIFIEVQTRYRYEQYFMLFILATPYLYRILNVLDILLKHIKKEKLIKNIEQIQ